MSRNSECDFVCAPISSLARGIPHATCSCTVVLRNVALSPSTRLSRSATIPAPEGHSAKPGLRLLHGRLAPLHPRCRGGLRCPSLSLECRSGSARPPPILYLGIVDNHY